MHFTHKILGWYHILIILPAIGVGGGKFLGIRRILPNFPQTCLKNEKYFKEYDFKKSDCISFHVGHIFSTQSTSSTIFAQIYPNFPGKYYIKIWPPKKSLCSYIFGAIIAKSKHIQRFCEGVLHTFGQISTDFALILSDFSQIFTKSNVLGMRLHTRLLHQCSLLTTWLHSYKSYGYFII